MKIEDLTLKEIREICDPAEGEYIRRIEVESVIHNDLHALLEKEQLDQLYKDINGLNSVSFPKREKGEWIPVTERLPEEDKIVLCSVKDPWNGEEFVVINSYNKELYWTNGAIKAWQPLPETYKGDKAE